jgi:hypothetical protein
MGYYCVTIGLCHVFFSPNLSDMEKFRDKHSPDAYIWQTGYPHHYGFAHRIGKPSKLES